MRAAHRVSLAIALGLTAVAQAQQRPPAAPQFKSGVELIQVDAVVIDAEGRHVRGLKAADFELRDRGKPQTIAAFEEITHERPRAEAADARETGSGPVAPLPLDVASNQTVQSERLVVLVIDDLHIWTGRTATAKTIAHDVLERLGRDASMAVLFTSGERSTQVTQDHAVLFRAIDSLKARQSLRRPTEAVDNQRGGGNLQSFFDNMSLFETMENAAAILGRGDATRKAFVLVSEGLMKNPTGIFQSMRATEQALQGGAAYAAGNLEAMNPNQPPPYHDYALIDMMEAMRRSNVTTYAIDPRGEITSQELAYESHPAPEGGDSVFRWNNPVRIAQDGLTTVAEASGGFAVVNTDDFTGGITRIVEDLDHYYLLGFYPADPGKKGYKQLDVRVAGHPDWTVRFRHGYRNEKEKSKAPAAKTDRDALMALSAGALPKTDLALRLGATPLAGDGKEVRVALAIEVSSPVKAMEDADGKLRDELRYEVLAVNERKKKVTRAGGLTARAVLSKKTDNTGPAPDTAVYQIADAITLEPGTYQLRVSADSKKLGKGGSVYLHLTVPDVDGEPVTIGGLALGYAQGERIASASVTRAQSRAQRAGRIQTVELPPAPPPLPFAATLDRTFTTSDVVRIYFEVARKDRRAPVAGTLDVERLGEGQARLSLPFTPDERGRVMLQLPMSRLTPGRYALRATVTSGAHSAMREMGVTVIASSR